MKKIVVFFLIFIISFAQIKANEDFLDPSCSYKGEFEKCLKQQNSPRAIEDFVCVTGSNEKILFQIVLDKKFKEIDLEIEKYLIALRDGKSYYFGEEKQENFTAGVDDIENYLGVYGVFEKEYTKLCSSTGENTIISDTVSCTKGKYVSNGLTENFLLSKNGNKSNCEKLYKTKLALYREVAYDSMKYNKQAVLKDSHKLFTQKQRTKYDKLLDLIRINIGYVERIWMKWPSKSNEYH